MSQALQAACRGGALVVSNGIDPPTFYSNGIPFDSDGKVAVQTGVAMNHYSQGLPFTATGRLHIAAVGVTNHYGPGAAPFTLNDGLSCGPASATHYVGGVPFTSSSQVHIV